MKKETPMSQNMQTVNVEPGASTPTVSVIIPCYKVAEYVGDALDSVFAQTFEDYEVIVINDGSPDTETFERVLEPYRERIVYLKQENRGLSGARNTGIQASRGPFIALLDADDMWEPEYLSVHIAMMKSDATIDVLYPNSTLFGDRAVEGQDFMSQFPSSGEVTFEKLVTQQCNVMVSATIRREALIKAGMFDEALRSSEDFDLWLRILKQGGRIAYHRRPLARIRRRPGSLTSDPVWMCQHILRVFEKAERTMNLTPDESKAVGRQRERFRATQRLYEGKRAFFQGDVETAISSLKEANSFFRSGKLALVLLLLRLAPQMLLRVYDARDRFVARTSTKF
ncbi:MAG: glycosyltransferase family 2 protein [Pyrinomonadaceae bacterium]